MKLSFQLFLFLTGSLAPIVSGITIPSPTKQEIYDIENTRNASSPGPLQFAVSHKVSVNPCNDGITSGNTWKLAVESPGATSLNFGFGTLKLSNGTKMRIKSAKDPQATEIEVDTNKNSSGEYWTQIFPTDKVDIFIDFSDGIICRDIELTSINVGFRGFGSDRSGSCNIDVVCPLRAGWEKEIKSVAGLSYGGSLFCTGAMINNMKEDQTPYFLTADHCGVGNAESASSIVTYWNYETSTCDGNPDGVLNQAVAGGAVVIASNGNSDVTLLKLNNDPPSSYEVSFAGWDNTPEAYTLPGVCIHHPNGDEKRISFEYNAMASTTYGGNSPGSYVRVEDWDEGTTEPGSSGSPLFNGNRRIIGQLSGGSAACGNDAPDWYGRFSKSWTDNEEIRAALDPDDDLNGGNGGIDTYDPYSFPTISPRPTNSPTTTPPTESPTPCNRNRFQLNLKTDFYGQETTWILYEQENWVEVASGGPYESEAEIEYVENACIDPGCYNFVIFDSYGDGICCSFGEGSYSISVDGVVVEEYNGQFDFLENTPFCTSNETCEDAQTPIAFRGNEYTCAEAAEECSDERVASHCPFTCNACSDYECADSQLQWVVNVNGDSRIFDCTKLSQYNGSCNYDFPVVASTCRESCDYCSGGE